MDARPCKPIVTKSLQRRVSNKSYKDQSSDAVSFLQPVKSDTFPVKAVTEARGPIVS